MDVYVINNNKLDKFNNNDDILYKLYYLEIEIPDEKSVLKAESQFDMHKFGDIKEFIINNRKNATRLISNSKYIPLYDIINNNIHLINKNDVYNMVVYEHYRYPNINKIKKKYNDTKNMLSKVTTEDKPIKERNLRKFKIMLKFMHNFDRNILYKIYVKSFYFSNPIGNSITTCLRKSFTPFYKHIKPFYDKEELIKMALNMKIIKYNDLHKTVINEYPAKNDLPGDRKTINTTNISNNFNALLANNNSNNKIDSFISTNDICNSVRRNDIPAKLLIDHQMHIFNNNCYGLIQYFTFHGSYFINQYLRGNTCVKNEVMDENIFLMNKLVRSAPKFDKDYTLYRFVRDDNYISKLRIGDVYVFDGFTSATRDPFYNPESYKFGFILIKIKIPKNMIGIALCVESISIFPSEQEIIIAPNAIMKLNAKNSNVEYYTLDKYQTLIETQYEFTFIKYDETQKIIKCNMPININTVDFLTLEKINATTLSEKIRHFITKYVNENDQFKTNIGTKTCTIITEWYNSTGLYKNFYAAKTSNGLSLYTQINGNVIFMIEIGENEEPYFYVNYYRKFALLQKNAIDVMDNDLLFFFAKIAYYFDINNILIYCDYISCDCYNPNKKKCRGGNYCSDFYNYFKYGNKRFEEKTQIFEIKPAFSYFNLDLLKKIDVSEVISKRQRDDYIYQIYKTIYNRQSNVCDFYIWLVENYCYLTSDFIQKISHLYTPNNNPFYNDYYIFNGIAYLYNNEHILYYKPQPSKMTGISKNRNRLDDYINIRI